MNTTLWIVQGLLAALFGSGGIVKAVRPSKRLYDQGLTWVEDFSPGAVKAIGGLELAAAVGLVLPAVTGVAPVLVPLAAVGLGLIMVGAAVVHVRRGEVAFIAVNVALLAAAAFVAWGRFGLYAF
ncbi:MAG TPA: DoxX family protein [Pseudonocardia sp.]|nr:DoxX family protein [Pseudonocardia sp.]